MEKYTSSCRLILVCNNIYISHHREPVRSRCLGVRTIIEPGTDRSTCRPEGLGILHCQIGTIDIRETDITNYTTTESEGYDV